MVRLAYAESPPNGLGMTSVVLGSVGLLLFFMPILGIPLCLVGLLFGVLGLVTALARGPSSLRWSLLGIVLCLLAGIVNVAIAFAPAGYIPQRSVPRTWQEPSGRPYVPPPARPEFTGADCWAESLCQNPGEQPRLPWEESPVAGL